MSKKSFADNLAENQVLVKALQERGGELPVGVTPEMVEELDKLTKGLLQANVEQERLKSQLKDKTAEAKKMSESLVKTKSLVRKYIKIGIPQQLWREFGITDKK